jgi:hypothetical protein
MAAMIVGSAVCAKYAGAVPGGQIAVLKRRTTSDEGRVWLLVFAGFDTLPTDFLVELKKEIDHAQSVLKCYLADLEAARMKADRSAHTMCA